MYCVNKELQTNTEYKWQCHSEYMYTVLGVVICLIHKYHMEITSY